MSGKGKRKWSNRVDKERSLTGVELIRKPDSLSKSTGRDVDVRKPSHYWFTCLALVFLVDSRFLPTLLRRRCAIWGPITRQDVRSVKMYALTWNRVRCPDLLINHLLSKEVCAVKHLLVDVDKELIWNLVLSYTKESAVSHFPCVTQKVRHRR